MSISEKVLDAIQILADNSVKKADYDRTIQAQILSCEDATIGKYRCRYQDAVFYAYSNNTDITYGNGALVYILVPGNDFKKEKTILGTTKKLGINYITQAEGDQAYDIIGTNGIEKHETFYLDTSYKNYSYTLYKSSRNKNDINVNQQALQRYIRMASSIIVGATIKTSIDSKRQTRGHYGITYNLKFIDNATGLQTIRSYTLDEDNMVDQPYRLLYPTRQIQIYDVDGTNFVEVDSIELFCKDFPESTEHTNSPLIKEEDPHDIQLTLLELVGASRMTEGQINGVAITFYTPQGTFFPAGESSGQKLIKAQVRVKGKLVAADQRISFYWGKQNLSVTPSSPYYNKYLGRGWKCINSSNVIDSDAKTQAPITIEWIPGKDTYIFNYNEATAKDNWLKVAIVYDGNIISKKINIQNLADKPYPIIESSDGTKFYYDVGHPTLTAKLMHKNEAGIEQEIVENVEYYWAYEDNAGNFMELPQTIDLNNNYHVLDAELAEVDRAIKDGTRFENEVAADKTIQDKKVQFKNYDFIQRVEGKQVHNVQIRNITSFGTFKCSIIQKVWNDTSKKYDDTYRGTAQITLTNSLDGQDLYSLVINNGSAVYQYNENGVAPNNKTLDNPQQIPALTFTVYDNQGKPLDSSMIVNDSKCKVRWKVPLGKDTLLIDNMPQTPNDPNRIQTESYVYYDKVETLSYDIANKYDIKKQNNQIQLIVNYKGFNLTARTNFTFAKQGEPGTNGTEYVVKIVPNTTMSNPPQWPMITKINGGFYANYTIGNGISTIPISNNNSDIKNGVQLFKAQLWQDGELIWEGFKENDEFLNGKPDLVHWEILQNKYNTNTKDISSLQINEKGFACLNNNYLIQETIIKDKKEYKTVTPTCDIVKCSITWGGQGKTYYGTIPVITAQVFNDNYKIGLKDFTGFRHVLYTSDGINPQYDNAHPFDFYCQQNILLENGQHSWEDVSTINGKYKVNYNFYAVGGHQICKIKKNENDEDVPFYEPENLNLLTILESDIYREGLTENQCFARPATRYDGQCVNVAIYCRMKQQIQDENGEKNIVTIGKIKVPIHYLLNKFGLSHINDWDGNSIQVNTDGGYILSPQMGAGVKNSSNQFTGVLMGEVITPNKKESDIGLLGYANGDRTIFLNSKNGSAIFGKANKGQIVIDPTSKDEDNDALLYSGNFWKEYNQSGLPSSYQTSNELHQGLLINLSKPEIRYGNNNFSVSPDGYIHAVGGGDIAGWQVSDTKLSSKNTAITLDSSGKIYSTKIVEKDGERVLQPHDSLNNSNEGFYLAANGLSIGDKFKISNQGRLRIGEGAVTEDKESKYWDINGYIETDKNGNPIYDENGKIKRRSYISYGGITSFSKAITVDEDASHAQKKAETVYIGTDGITLGKRFSVDKNGKLIAYSGIIGGWTIDSSRIYAKNADLDSISIELNKNGSIKGGYSSVYVDKDHPNENTQWSISNKGVASFNYIKANSGGKIGCWTIDGNSLKTGNVTIDKNGSISTTNWSINSDGTSTFKNVTTFTLKGTGTVASGSLSSGGGGIGMNSGNGWVTPGTVRTSNGGNQTLGSYIETLITDNLTVNHSFRYKNDWVSWNHISYVSGIQYKNNTLYWTTNQRYILSTDGSNSWNNNTGVIAPSSDPHS